MRENELLAQLPGLFRTDDPTVVVGSGPDDCAHVHSPDARLAFSVDAFAEGSHFLPDDRPEDIASKSLVASLSDLAASACKPLWALVSLCLRKSAPADWAERFASALAETARGYGTTIVGGDITSAPGGTFVSVTVAGVPLPGGPLLRSGAKAGDVVVTTGELGGSILGKHLRPTARVREITELMEFCADADGLPYPTACMDISDGLALDLSRLCRESGVGAVVDACAVPLSGAARERSAQSGKPPLAHALSDGEDFELLLTMPLSTWSAWDDRQKSSSTRFTRIGETTAEPGLLLRAQDGATKPLAAEGYEHTW